MNIWALNKTTEIKTLLIGLSSEFGEDKFVFDVSDKWGEAGVYIRNKDEPELCAYVYTAGQRDKCFGVDLEYPVKHNPVNLSQVHENIDYAQLKDVLCTHLNVFEDPF